MSRVVFWGFGLFAAALAAVIALELTPQAPEDTGLPEAAPRHVAAAPPPTASEPAAPEDHIDEWVQTVLARPVFAKDRKPEAEADATPSGPASSDGLPRLTGVLVGPFGRAAIFSASDTAKATIIKEGSSLGAFRVQAIEPGQVTLVGPDGPRVLHPAFDPNLQHRGPEPAVQPGMPQPGMPQVPQPGVPFVPGQPIQPGQPQLPRRSADFSALPFGSPAAVEP